MPTVFLPTCNCSRFSHLVSPTSSRLVHNVAQIDSTCRLFHSSSRQRAFLRFSARPFLFQPPFIVLVAGFRTVRRCQSKMSFRSRPHSLISLSSATSPALTMLIWWVRLRVLLRSHHDVQIASYHNDCYCRFSTTPRRFLSS